jgi:hypothetical protein
MHLHGHDFWVIGQGLTTFDNETFVPKIKDAPRRDVAMLPGGGYLMIAFLTDNPGAWLLHCHIGWHASQGFALTFLEREKEVKKMVVKADLDKSCTAWKDFARNHTIEQHDSGV